MLHCICINLEMIIPVPYVLLCCSASMETRKTCILFFRMQVPLSVWGGFLLCFFCCSCLFGVFCGFVWFFCGFFVGCFVIFLFAYLKLLFEGMGLEV